MADELISRKALLEDIEETVIFTVQKDVQSAEMRGANKVIDRIKAAPAVDAVEVVRCKDCKYLNAEYRCVNWKGLYDYTKADDFCSYAERREDNG